MARKCKEDEYWDGLVNKCMHCQWECQQTHIIPKCISYCELANCMALPGHYYDALLKKCVRCADVCGGHPAECSQQCQTLTTPITTKKLLVQVTSHRPTKGFQPPTEDSTILLYSLLGLCLMLLFTSLFLALVVFLRRSMAKTSNSGPKEANHRQECGIQPGQEVGRSAYLPKQSSNDFATNPSPFNAREPSADSIPTETCVCVHCFPDLKALDEGNDRPPKAPFALYPHAVLHRAQIQNGGPLWTEGSLQSSGWEVRQEGRME